MKSDGNVPNILLIMTDQQRFDTIGALGNPFIQTPNIDRLVAEGTSFTSAYTPSPVCVPARCALMYGRYPLYTGCLENNYPMPEQGKSFADYLSEAGYRTHAVGKRHFTPDPQAKRGFQTIESQEELVDAVEDDDYLLYLRNQGLSEVYEPFGVRGEAYYVPQLSPLLKEHHPTQWVGDRAVNWIEDVHPQKNPFMLFCSFVHPHPPFSPPSPWHKLYRAMDMPDPYEQEDQQSLWVYTNKIQNRYKGRDAGTDRRLQQLMKAYYWASISFVDYQIGRIIDSLNAKGLLDSTMIIFTSDHGEFLGDYGCYGKRSFLDVAAKIPLICRYPDSFPKNVRCNKPVSLVDILPTFLHESNISMPEGSDGVALQDIVHDRSDRERIFGHYQHHEAAIYTSQSEQYSYIWSASDNKEFLFDRKVDPHQTKNRAYNLLYHDKLSYERSQLIAHLQQYESSNHICTDTSLIPYPHHPEFMDADEGLIIQDPHCFLDKFFIKGYSNISLRDEFETKADFDPLNP